MGEVRNQFTFYRSFYESLMPLYPEERANIILAICAYALYEEEPTNLTSTESACFNLVRPILDAGRKKAAAGRKGGEANGKQGDKESNGQADPEQGDSESKYKNKYKDKSKDKKKNKDKCLHPPISPFSGQNGTETAAQVWNEVLDLYPSDHLGDQMEAEAAYKMRVTTETDAHSMLTNLRLWKQSEQWNKDGGQFIPQLVNWISRGIWKTTPPKLITPKGASGELGLAEMEAIWKMFPPEEAEKMRQKWEREHEGMV